MVRVLLVLLLGVAFIRPPVSQDSTTTKVCQMPAQRDYPHTSPDPCWPGLKCSFSIAVPLPNSTYDGNRAELL